jgi:hypothetical protein
MKVSRVEQELPTHPEYLGSSPDFSGVRVAQSLVFSVVASFSGLTNFDCPFGIL